MTHEIEEFSESISSNEMFYDDKAIRLGSFIGGPLTAGYLIAKNFTTLNERKKVIRTWLWTVVGAIVAFGIEFLIGEVEMPIFLIPFLYAIIASFLFRRYQEYDVAQYLDNGGKKYSLWRVLGISVVGLVITVISILCIILLWENYTEESISV